MYVRFFQNRNYWFSYFCQKIWKIRLLETKNKETCITQIIGEKYKTIWRILNRMCITWEVYNPRGHILFQKYKDNMLRMAKFLPQNFGEIVVSMYVYFILFLWLSRIFAEFWNVFLEKCIRAYIFMSVLFVP